MTPDLDGWIPIRIYYAEGKAMVDWCYLGTRTFVEPFFDQTISACLAHPFNLLFRQQTPIEVLVDRYQAQPGLDPTGFIFHMSRSGSTLVSQMFAALQSNIVISEGRPVDAVIQAHFHSATLSEEQNLDWFRAMLSALGQPRRGSEEHLFIKFEAWHVLMLPIIRKAFPEVPWIFLYRDPIDVLFSQMELPGQMIPGFLHYHLYGQDANRVASLPPEEYRAVLLASLCQAALGHQSDGGRLINYAELPAAVGSSISQVFDVQWTEVEMAAMIAKTSKHSKEQVAFKPDSAKKQEHATPAVRQAAERWLFPTYEKLEGVRLAVGNTRVVNNL